MKDTNTTWFPAKDELNKYNQIAIFPLSADPITLGHVRLIKRASKIFSKLIVAIGNNPQKKTIFSIEERLRLSKTELRNFNNIEITSFSGLLTDYANSIGVRYIIKGVRNTIDLEYENNLASIGRTQDKQLETVLLISEPQFQHISSSAAKALSIEFGDCSHFLSPRVHFELYKKLINIPIIGVTGSIASGKSTFMKHILSNQKDWPRPIHHIDCDKLGHQLLEEDSSLLAQQTRSKLIRNFGDSIIYKNKVDRKLLSKIVFSKAKHMNKLNQIMKTPLLLKIKTELLKVKENKEQKIVFINAALFVESNLLPLSHNNICLIDCPQKIQEQRLKERGLNRKQISERLNAQLTNYQKLKTIKQRIKKDTIGKVWRIDGSKPFDNSKLKSIFDEFTSS